MLLIVPLPYTWKRKLFNFISENPLIAKVQYAMKVDVLVCFTVLCADQRTDYLYIHSDSFCRQRQPSLPSPGRTGYNEGESSRVRFMRSSAIHYTNRGIAEVFSVDLNVWKSRHANSILNATCTFVASRCFSP